MAPEAIRTAIIDPERDIAAGYAAGLMPRNFAERMTVRELQLIVDLLAGPGR